MAALIGFSLCLVTVNIVQAATLLPMMTTDLPMTMPPCADTVANCVSYGSHICNDTYSDWAKIHCKDFCGLCVDHINIPTHGPPEPSPGTCQDEVNDCHTYGKDLCHSTDFHVWAKQHCASYCGFCGNPGVPCVDMLHNCDTFGIQECSTSSYIAKYCPAFCGHCSGVGPSLFTTAPCFDKHNDCQRLGKSFCHTTYGRQECARTCNACGSIDIFG